MRLGLLESLVGLVERGSGQIPRLFSLLPLLPKNGLVSRRAPHLVPPLGWGQGPPLSPDGRVLVVAMPGNMRKGLGLGCNRRSRVA
jgi:hypothetical protein